MFIIVTLVVVLLVLILYFIPGRTSKITDAQGNPLAGSIASLEKINLGDTEQWILIRGENTANPVLLFLHGGPGTSELGLVRKYNMPALEKYFTVVLWDQRGTGKSYASIKPESGMNLEQFISDAHELTLLLCKRFNKKQIGLAGHSWGSALGVLTVKKYPELFYAYIGIGQLVNMPENERISYEWTLEQTMKANDKKSVKKLKEMGTPPYSGDWRSNVITQRKILGKYGGEVHNNHNGGFFIAIRSLFVREYRWKDRFNFFRGILGSMRLLWPQLYKIDLNEQASELYVPVFLLEGKHDFECPHQLAEQYYGNLKAPFKKLVWFDNSAHFVNAEESGKFNEFFISEIQQLGKNKI